MLLPLCCVWLSQAALGAVARLAWSDDWARELLATSGAVPAIVQARRRVLPVQVVSFTNRCW